MSYHDLLYKYGSEQESAETRIYIYVQHPAKLKTFSDVSYRDKDAAQQIAQLETLIENLKDYRVALAERFGDLATMPYTRKLKIERCPHWRGHIEYIVEITRTMQDGTSVSESREVFPGKSRRAAFDRFNELKKQFPGIAAEADIEKRSWER